MEDQIAEHLKVLAGVNGKRLEIFDRLGVPNGWVATTRVPKGFWDKCLVAAIPMKANRFLWFFPSPATKEMARWVRRYGKKIMVVMIPDEEAEGYSGGAILLDDLYVDPNTLFDESLAQIGTDDNLSDMKRRVAMMLLGWADTK